MSGHNLEAARDAEVPRPQVQDKSETSFYANACVTIDGENNSLLPNFCRFRHNSESVSTGFTVDSHDQSVA